MKKRSHSVRKKVGDIDHFALAAHLFYQPEASIEQIGNHFNFSAATVKRMLRRFRQKKIVQGRLGSMKFNLAPLPEFSSSFCKAIVAAETDIEQVKTISHADDPKPHDTEQVLLYRLCNELPREERYAGRIIVEVGYIVMGEPQFSLLMIVYGASTSALFEFSRFGLERTDGVHRTRTLMVTCTTI
jgi:DNA-binding Lrp family transcriptional regulator